MEEVFRITPKVDDGNCYEYAEYTSKEGRWPNERYYTNVKPQYVGKLVEKREGGHGDGHWRTDIFDDYGRETIVHYSYEGKTCFRVVPCRDFPSLQELARKVVKKDVDYSSLPPGDPLRNLIEENHTGGKSRRHKKAKKSRRHKKAKKSRRNRNRKTIRNRRNKTK